MWKGRCLDGAQPKLQAPSHLGAGLAGPQSSRQPLAACYLSMRGTVN